MSPVILLNWVWHDYEGLTGVDLETRESAGYQSSGVNMTWTTGRLFYLGGSGGVLMPEIGGEYLYLQRERFTTQAEAANWNMSNSRVEENQVTGLASIRWLGRMRFRNKTLVPSISTGLRLLVTDETIGETQSAGSTTTLVRAEQDRVTGSVSASLLLEITAHWQAELSYGGVFSSGVGQQNLAFRWRISF